MLHMIYGCSYISNCMKYNCQKFLWVLIAEGMI